MRLKVLQFNIWQEGTVVKGGFDAVVDEIIHTGADVVTLSEVRNYHNQIFFQKIIEALQRKGQQWYSFESDDSGILSRFPIKKYSAVYPVKNDHGSAYKANMEINKIPVAVYTTHLDYLNAANYLPRGYDGNSWKKLSSGKVNKVDSVLACNHASRREKIMRLILQDARTEIKRGNVVILGGDFNEPSFLDWTIATKDSSDHNGLVIDWPTTQMLSKAGFVDSYRQVHPDPVTSPGYTFPANNTNIDLKKLVWAANADERDRIDFIFYHRDKRIKCVQSIIVGPKGDIVRGQRQVIPTQDSILAPLNIWPTDHKAVLSTFEVKQK